MTQDDDDGVDPVLEVLTEYEEKLRTLQQNDQLAAEAHRTFGALALELERRTGGDRRRAARAGGDRRTAPHEDPVP